MKVSGSASQSPTLTRGWFYGFAGTKGAEVEVKKSKVAWHVQHRWVYSFHRHTEGFRSQKPAKLSLKSRKQLQKHGAELTRTKQTTIKKSVETNFVVTLQRCGRVWREGGAKPGVLWRSWWGERNIRCASFLFVPVEGQATPFTTHMHTWNRNLNVSPPHTGRTSPQPVMDCWLHIPLAASSSLRFVVITWLYTARAFVIYHTECNFLQ